MGNYARIYGAFEKKGPKEGPLRVFWDVATRWDSTYRMILRYTRLLEPINQYITKTNLLYLKLRKIEVQQVQYLIDLVKPFCAFTQAISRTTTPTIQQVFPIYNTLLSHLN